MRLFLAGIDRHFSASLRDAVAPLRWSEKIPPYFYIDIKMSFIEKRATVQLISLHLREDFLRGDDSDAFCYLDARIHAQYFIETCNNNSDDSTRAFSTIITSVCSRISRGSRDELSFYGR
jgi:hypothetical protein